MPSLLLVSLRAGSTAEQISTTEHRDFLHATGLNSDQLPQLILDSTDTVIGDLAGYDGILIGGSSLNITDDPWGPWQKHIHTQMQKIVDSGLPAFFVCYGCSWLTHSCGGEIGHTHAETSGPTVVELTDEGRKDPLTRGFPDSFTSLTGHTENVEILGEGLTVLATGPTCPVQFIRYRDNVWATQFHSDMDATAMRNRMDFYYDYGYFSPDDYDSIIEKLPHIDTMWSNRLMRNFVEYVDQHK